jgi:hypothetical protein
VEPIADESTSRSAIVFGHVLSDDDPKSLHMSPTITPEIAPHCSTGRSQSRLSPWRKTLLILGALWAALVIVPDFYRVTGHLSSFGFAADNDGVIYEVSGEPATLVTIPGETEPGLKKTIDRID